MGNIVQPFDFNPVSVSVKTASFTIPAGKYALVEAQVRGGGTFTIGGAIALKSQITSIPTKVAQTISTVVSFTVPADSIFEGQVQPTSVVEIDGFANAVDDPGEFSNFKAGPGSVIDTSTSTATLTGYTRRVTGDEIESVTRDFWVPTGTVLNGTGDFRFTVSQFNIVT